MSSLTGCYQVVKGMGKFKGRTTVPELCEVITLSKSTIEKAMVALVNGGLVISTRGFGGGYDLTKPFDTITVGDLSACAKPRGLFERLVQTKSEDILLKDL